MCAPIRRILQFHTGEPGDYLGNFELMLSLALLRLGDAYGVLICGPQKPHSRESQMELRTAKLCNAIVGFSPLNLVVFLYFKASESVFAEDRGFLNRNFGDFYTGRDTGAWVLFAYSGTALVRGVVPKPCAARERR
jgi:hypothetical protein